MKKVALLLLAAAGLAGCNPKGEEPPVPVTTGVAILSEGQFGAGDGAVSTFDKSTKALVVDAFGAANGAAKLGDVVQDMGVAGGRGYICVNASRKVEVVNITDFKSVATIRRIEQPRYFAASATRGYVTSWRGNFTAYQPGKVMVIDLSTNALIDSITVGRCPEKPALVGNVLYVPNSYDSTVSIIDLTTNKVTGTLAATPGPQTVLADNGGSLWVLCQRPYGSSATPAAALLRFALGTTSGPTLSLPIASGNAQGLAIDGPRQQLYYSSDGLEYRMAVTATSLPTTPFIQRSFNGFAIDPRDNTIFAAVLTSYTTNGRFVRYPAAGGAAIDSFTVKVGPNGFVFY